MKDARHVIQALMQSGQNGSWEMANLQESVQIVKKFQGKNYVMLLKSKYIITSLNTFIVFTSV